MPAGKSRTLRSPPLSEAFRQGYSTHIGTWKSLGCGSLPDPGSDTWGHFNDQARVLTEPWIGLADHCQRSQPRQLGEQSLDLGNAELLPADVDQLGRPAVEHQQAGLGLDGHVPGPQPAVGRHRRPGQLWVAVVAAEHARTLVLQLTRYPRRARPRVLVEDTDRRAGRGAADADRPALISSASAAGRAAPAVHSSRG